MKKLVLALLICAPILSRAQMWYVGANTGVSFSNYKAKTPWKEVPNRGFTFGLKGFRQISSNFGWTLGLDYIQKGYYHKICNEIYDQLEADYVEVPVTIDYTFIIPALQNWRGHLNLGVYGAYWLNAKYEMKGFDETSEEFDFEKNMASHFDFGPNAGGRIEYVSGNGSISLDFRYELGLADLQKQVNDNTKNANRVFTVGISYLKAIRK